MMDGRADGHFGYNGNGKLDGWSTFGSQRGGVLLHATSTIWQAEVQNSGSSQVAGFARLPLLRNKPARIVSSGGGQRIMSSHSALFVRRMIIAACVRRNVKGWQNRKPWHQNGTLVVQVWKAETRSGGYRSEAWESIVPICHSGFCCCRACVCVRLPWAELQSIC